MISQPSHQPAVPLLPVSDPVSRTDLIVDTIRRAILGGRLQPGDSLVERELAEMLGVSKTPIREALKILSQSGLVSVVAFRGVTVRVVDHELVHSVYDARLLIEPDAIRRAVPRHTSETLAEARALLQQGDEAGRQGDWMTLNVVNRQFHQALYSQCDNPLLLSFLDQVQDQVALIAIHAWRGRDTWPLEANEHEAILAAIEARNPRDAAARVRRHVASSLKRVLEVL